MSHRKDTDYLSISARVRAMENRLLTRERMDRMIDARERGGREGAGRVRLPRGGEPGVCAGPGPGRYLPGHGAAVPDPRLVEIFQLKYDYHNAKALLKAQPDGADASRLLVPRRTV
ncbi:MAG: hypothetical protein V8S34_03210 [Lawsonibacter sp.]